MFLGWEPWATHCGCDWKPLQQDVAWQKGKYQHAFEHLNFFL